MKTAPLTMRKITLSLLLIVSFITTNAQDFSNKGKEFWLAYSYHVGMVTGGQPAMTLFITSDQTTTYSVEIYGALPTILQSGTINAGQVITVTIPNSYFINDEGFFNNKAIRVSAVKPVVVYSYITRNAASAATLCLPTNVLGREYYTMSFKQASNEASSNSFVTIIAVEDNTTVQIIPSVDTKNGWLAGSINNVTLNKGQIYQILGTTGPVVAGVSTGGDLTGTIVKSISTGAGGCQRIAVFSGSGKIFIPATCNNQSSDNLYQQLYPTGSWGKKYITIPSYNRPNNYYRIARMNAAANVTVNGVAVPGASFTNGYYQFQSNVPNVIESDQPISVAQFFTTQNCDGNGNPYDPDMIILNPVEQNINKVTLVSSSLVASPPQHHVHVVMKNTGTAQSSFRFDNNTVPAANWTPVANDPTYSYLYLNNVSQGFHTLYSDTGFNAIAYGYAPAESYGYSAGSNVKDLYQFASVQNQDALVTFPAACKGSPFYMYQTLPYQPTSIIWHFYGLFPDYTMSSPVHDSTYIVNGKQVWRYKIPTPYTINTVGVYPITVEVVNPTADGCSGLQEIDFDLEVFPPPVADFTWNHTGCVTDTVYFAENSTNTGGRPVYKWRWSFHDGGIDSIKNPKKKYILPGSFPVNLQVVTDVGCRSDTLTKTINISEVPVCTVNVSTPRCAGSVVTFTPTCTIGGGGTITHWIWHWDDGTPDDTVLAGTPIDHIFLTPGTYNVTITAVSSSGCKGATTLPPVVISGAISVNFNLPANVCLPEGLATFVNTSNGGSPAGVATYTWNFGDLSPTVNSLDGVHNYTAVGPFNVTLSAVSSAGCPSLITKPFNNIRPQPTAGFTSNPDICLSDSLQFNSTSTGNGGNITEYHWDFGDATTSTLQNPKKRWNTTGLQTVKHWIRTDQGCYSDTLTKTIYVNALPVSDFTFPATGRCASKSISFTSAATATDGVVDQWAWDFGDPGSGANNTSSLQNPSHTFSTPGTYNVKLRVRTDKGCFHEITKVVTVSATPVAAFTPPAGICLPSGLAQFTNTTTISDASTLSYQWNFGDGSPVLNSPPNPVSPTYNYSGTGPYTVQLIAISSGGCRDTTTRNLSNIFPQPHADFTANPEVCLNDTLQFTDISVSNGGTVNEWHWDFGDATTSTVQNPRKAWNTAGPKTVKLWVKTTNGCPSDTMTKTITVNPLPTASFTVSPVRCEGSAITFTSTSVPNAGTITEWAWDFGDPGSGANNTSTLQNPTHIYATGGPKTIKLTVKTDKGCVSAVATNNITVNVKPVPNFDFPANVCLPAGVTQFTNTTTISDGTILSMNYLWDFGDPGSGVNNTSAQTNPSHTYNAAGPFSVKLKATSNNSCTDSITRIVNTIRPRPTANFTSNPEVCLSDSLQFNSTSLGNGGTINEWNWDFGDGTTSNLQNPKKRWTTSGLKTIKHWIRTDQGCLSDTMTKTIYVNALPVPDFTISSPRCEGQNITFTDASTSADGAINAWNWDLGDGNTVNNSSNAAVIHPYSAVGTYSVSLRVTTVKGCTSAAPTVKQVQVYNNPVAKFGLPEACVTDAVQFSDSSSIADGTEAQFTYLWNFGDPGSAPNNTSTLKNPTHLFTAAGNYNIRLVVTSNQGCTAQADSAFTVNGAVPVANYTVNTAAPLCSNKEVVIQNTSTVDFGNITKVEVYWDWTNNPLLKTVDDVPTPGKLYNFDYPDFNTPATKTYTIRFLAYSGTNCVSSRQATITVTASPILRFDPLLPICAEEPAIQLTQASETAGLPGNGVFTGPGITGSTFDPAVAGVGSHVIRYTYNAANGCTAFREQTIVVNETPRINAGPDRTVLEGGSVVLLGSSNVPGTTFLWTPGTRLSNNGIPQPSSSPADDITYTLTGRTPAGCEATDQVFVKVLKGPRIPNAFSPNGDGINDRWEIEFLDTYIGCTVEVYNIYGQIVFRSTGYSIPWDGTFKGKQLPVGTYYYIIEPKNGRSPITGYVGIVR